MSESSVSAEVYETINTDVQSKVQLNIPSAPEFVGVARLTISGIASRLQFSIEEIEEIKIAVSEAITNALQHGYDSDPNNTIEITCTPTKKAIEVQVKDTGKGFDPSIIGTPEQKEESEAHLGLGLGITFIKNLMDTLDIKSEKGQGTTITFSKNR